MNPFSLKNGSRTKLHPGSHETARIQKYCNNPSGFRNICCRLPGVVDDPLGFTFIDDKKKLTLDLLDVRFLLEPAIAEMAALHAEETDIRKISTLCDEVEALLLRGEDHTGKDIEFHTAIAMSSKNLVVPRLIPVINSSIPLFIQLTNNRLLHETIGTHREITDAIAAHDTLRAKDAMYLHLVYNRRCLLDQKA